MKKLWKNWPLAALAGAGVLALAAVLARPHYAQANARYLRHAPPAEGDGRTLVAYYSRSGYTKIMATELAQRHQARLLELVDHTYQSGLGYAKAVFNAHKKQAAITPATVDLTGYDTVYIGTPIWRNSPAPAAWAFVQQNQLAGKQVFLFNTLSSKFEQHYIDEFAALVRQRGGTFGGHLYARSEKQTPAQFAATVRAQLK